MEATLISYFIYFVPVDAWMHFEHFGDVASGNFATQQRTQFPNESQMKLHRDLEIRTLNNK
jgi:hypothetical protein